MKKKSLYLSELASVSTGKPMGKLAVGIAIGYCVAVCIYLLHFQRGMTINKNRIQERNG